MNTKKSFDDHCWHIRGITMLSQSPLLRRAVAIALSLRTLEALASGALSPLLPDALKQGRDGGSSLTALGDEWWLEGLSARVEKMVKQAESDFTRGVGGRLYEAIKARAAEWSLLLAPARRASEAAQEIERAAARLEAATGNPNVSTQAYRAATERATEILHGASVRKNEIDGRRATTEAELVRELERQRKQEADLEQLQQSETQKAEPHASVENRFTPKQLLPSLGFGLAAFTVVVILGVSVVTAALAGIIAAALLAIVRWRAGKASADEHENNAQGTETERPSLARRMPSRLRDKILAYGRVIEEYAIVEAEESFARHLARAVNESDWGSRASVLQRALGDVESNLKQEWEALPEGIFHEVDPGHVELLGRELADMLAAAWMGDEGSDEHARRVLSSFAAREGAQLVERLRAGDGAAVATSVVAAASAVYGNLALSETFARLTENASGQRLLLHWLDALSETACSALALGQEMSLDPALSIVRLTIGLPSGETDPLAQLLRQRITHAGVTLSSLPDAIEFIFDVRNLPVDALLTHELSQEHYEAANSWERQNLWHYPRSAGAATTFNPDEAELELDSGGNILPAAPLQPFVQESGRTNGNGNGKRANIISPSLSSDSSY